jgi:hypothetical protein
MGELKLQVKIGGGERIQFVIRIQSFIQFDLKHDIFSFKR